MGFKILRQLKCYKKILVNIEPANTKTLIPIKPDNKYMSTFWTSNLRKCRPDFFLLRLIIGKAPFGLSLIHFTVD